MVVVATPSSAASLRMVSASPPPVSTSASAASTTSSRSSPACRVELLSAWSSRVAMVWSPERLPLSPPLCNSVQDTLAHRHRYRQLRTNGAAEGQGDPMANPLAGVDTSDAPYVIVSSDTHAGLQVEEYRDYLDAAFHPQFEEWVRE